MGNIHGINDAIKVTLFDVIRELVPQPKNMIIIGTKWVYRNKLDEDVARLESIRILLAYAYALDFKLFQMDVKSAFLNGFINEEVYVAQPLGFIDFKKPDHVYKLKKALYGLKQAPKAWYDRLKAFLIKHEYNMGMVDNMLFTKNKSSNLIIVQIYVDDIIFGSTCQDMCDDFAKIMHDEFEMSMMGELNFFLGLQIKQMKDGIFFNQSKYIKEMLKKFGLEDSKPMKTPMSSDTKLTKDEECESVDSTKYRGMIGTTHLGLWYPKGTGIETVVYADSDHAGDYVTMPRKTAEDHQNTKSYIPKISNEYNAPLKHMFEFLENRCIHEGRVVYLDFDDLVYVRSMFGHIGFDCLLDIYEQIVPRFILELYSQYRVNYTLKGQMLIEFVIQDQLFSYTLEEFGQIIGIPFRGQCSFSDKWSLDNLQFSVPTGGPYQTNPPSSDEIKLYVQEEREGHVTRIRHDKVIDVKDNQILTREIITIMKTWVDIIRENVFCLGGNRDHVLACLCHMLYCIARSERYNLAYFIAKANGVCHQTTSVNSTIRLYCVWWNVQGDLKSRGRLKDVSFMEIVLKIEESLNVTFDETPPPSKTSPWVDDDLDEEESIRETEKHLENVVEDETLEIDEIVNIKESRNHPLENVIGNLNQRTLRLVAQGYNQQEGIDYDETYTPVARLESIRILLAYAYALDFKLFQMDVKSTFLNGFINEEKQTALAISTTEAEYVSAEKACQQALWMKKALIDYDVTMPRKSSEDYKNTRHYIPKISHEFRTPIREKLMNLEERYIYEGQVVFENFTCLNYVRSLFHFVEFECLLEINEQICPRFILEFYSQYQINYSDEGQMFVEFVIQNQLFSYSLEKFAQILDIPCKGSCVFTDRWRLDKLAYVIPSDVRRIRHEEEIDVLEYQILTREIMSSLNPLEEIIRENIFCLGVIGIMFPHDFVSCFIVLYTSKNPIFPITWLNEWSGSLSKLDRVMNAAKLKQNPRRDRGTRRGRHSTSSSSAFDQPSLSHLNDDDDDGNDEGTSRASTPSPIRYVNSLINQVPQVF
ncbi:retrovirus-related pol polyprotein from transposon TNT 1-94 [Tanacetum coccineum]